MAKPKLGSGKRFANLTHSLMMHNPELKNPAGLAAKIGRAKFGKKRFQKLAAKGK